MSVKLRLLKLEAAMFIETDTIQIVHFIVEPGDLDPIGYVCDGIEIVRRLGESSESLRKRCCEAVSWPDEPSKPIFYPLRGSCH